MAPTRSKTIRLARQIRKQQRHPVDQIKSDQLHRLQVLFKVAEQESAFYRQRWHAQGLSADRLRCLDDLQQFPVTRKVDLESNFPDGLAIASRKSPDWQYVGTRGTTRRVMVIHDFERRDHERAAIMVALTEDSPYRYGTKEVSIPPDACSVHCGIESDRADSVSQQLLALATRHVAWNRESISDLRGLVMDKWICAKTVLPPLPLDGDDSSLRECVSKLREERPVQLTALPEYLRALADYVRRTADQPPPIPVIRPMGANFPKTWKADIESALRGSLREHYGSREMGPMAFDCQRADGMHLLMSQHLIEIVDDNGNAVPEGEVGRVLVTDLHNLSMPIVRYNIGDLARMDSSECGCGRTTERIHLEGRVDDALVKQTGGLLTAEAVSNFFSSQSEVKDFQITEGLNGRLTIRVVPAEQMRVDERGLAERFVLWSGEHRDISVRITQAIRPEDSGKYRHCKNRPSKSADTRLRVNE